MDWVHGPLLWTKSMSPLFLLAHSNQRLQVLYMPVILNSWKFTDKKFLALRNLNSREESLQMGSPNWFYSYVYFLAFFNYTISIFLMVLQAILAFNPLCLTHWLLGLSSTSDVVPFDHNWHSTSARGKGICNDAQIRVISQMEPEICTKLLKTLIEKLRPKFPTYTPGCSMLKIAWLDDAFLEVFNCKQAK